MQDKFELEKLYRVYDMTSAEVGVYIEVKPNADFPEQWITIHTEGKASEEYYGKLELNLPNEQARLLAKAILDLCKDDV